MLRRLSPLLLLPLLAASCAPGPMEAVHADRWADAEREAAASADPVAAKLVAYYRMIAPKAATAGEIAAFVAANPAWPNQPLLERRRQEALANEPDQAQALTQCDRAPLTVPAAMLRCAEAYTAGGRPDDAAHAVRLAWTSGGFADAAAEAGFLRRWGAIPMPADQWARFETLASSQLDAAARQAGRLDAEHKPLALARLAFRRDDAAAEAKLAAIPAALRGDPMLMLDRAGWLRRRDRLDEARDLWLAGGEAAERAADPTRLGAFWSERNQLGRRLLRAGDDKGAYAVVSRRGATAPAAVVDAEFLAGFVALRRLHDPAAATAHFMALDAYSKAALTQSRAHYWLGRAAAEAGRDPLPEYRQAAGWPVTFYGQLAALAIDRDPVLLATRIRAARDPAWTRDAAFDFAGTEFARAVSLLVAWGEPRRAHAFLLQADDVAPVPSERSLVAHFATGLGMPDMAVAIARRMGRDGEMLPEAGWPLAFLPPAGRLDPAVALALMRQESSFDIAAVSPSGARGLMQLMPATARMVARQTAEPLSLPALTEDAQLNMRLGTAYFAGLMAQFGDVLPLAIAAYNAGPNRVVEWLGTNGDPRVPDGVAMLDWIELIPFNETRNYVQRVLENAVVYRARVGGDAAPATVAGWTG